MSFGGGTAPRESNWAWRAFLKSASPLKPRSFNFCSTPATMSGVMVLS